MVKNVYYYWPPRRQAAKPTKATINQVTISSKNDLILSDQELS